MSPRPIFAVTHPRSCSTAFERVFLSCRDVLTSQHESFGDAYYFGPESLSDRYRKDGAARTGMLEQRQTYKAVLKQFEDAQKDGKRLFIKDMAYYLMPPMGQLAGIAPSLGGGVELGNPTVIPLQDLKRFQFTFLIRHPRQSIPSFYRCTVPPLNGVTGFNTFLPSEAGYDELVRLFNYLLANGVIDRDHLTVIDADDLLDNPEDVLRQYCDHTGLHFDPAMLVWNEADREHATELFAKWNGFHDDVLKSCQLNARTHAQRTSTVESENSSWVEKYGFEAQQVIREVVNANIPHYEYLKQFCLQTKE